MRKRITQRAYRQQQEQFYAVGKDFADDWLERNPDDSEEQLAKAILDGQEILPRDSILAKAIAERIAEETFILTGRRQGMVITVIYP